MKRSFDYFFPVFRNGRQFLARVFRGCAAMEDSFLSGIKIQNDIAVMDDVADSLKLNRDCGKFCLKISAVACVQFVSRVIAEYCDGYALLHFLQQAERFDADVIIHDKDGCFCFAV